MVFIRILQRTKINFGVVGLFSRPYYTFNRQRDLEKYLTGKIISAKVAS